jgi:serine/threonine protein kinase
MTIVAEEVVDINAIDVFVGSSLLTDVSSKTECQGGSEGRVVDVTWKLSGGPLCSVRVAPKSNALELRTQIHGKVGLPIAEQRIYDGDVELTSTVVIPPGVVALSLLLDGDPRNTNIAYFSAMVNMVSSIAGELIMVKKLADAINGTVGLYRWKRPGHDDQRVAVKKMANHKVNRNQKKEICDWSAHLNKHASPFLEDSLTEIGVLSYLSQQHDLSPHLLKMRAVYADSNFTWLVTEFADGGELFGQAAASHVVLSAETIRLHLRHILEAIAYLHSHKIGHRDVSLENILLQEGKAKLMDFGMAAQTHSSSGVALRYFRSAGKEMYRAPECYVPPLRMVRVRVPKDASPGDVIMATVAGGYLCEVRLPEKCEAGEECQAEPFGYALPLPDVFAVAVCLFVLGFRVPPWRKAALSDPYFAFVNSCGGTGIESLLQRWGKATDHLPAEAMDLMTKMLHTDPSKRASVDECLASPWFTMRNDAG